jgi:putative toxin-antitoxin system antitoxin component (TIGR02293 family)
MSAAFDILADLPTGPTLALVDQIDQGLPLRAVDRLADRIAPDDKGFKYHFVSRPTYARRKAQGPAQARLSPAESDKVVRFARVWDMAVRVWKDDDAARAFLERPHPLLEGRSPLALTLAGEQGGRMVEDILGRLLHGTGV